jgi:hypothetical protein
MGKNYEKFFLEEIQIPNECTISCPFECYSINYKTKLNSFLIDDQFIQIIDDIPNTYSNMSEIEFKFFTPNSNLYNFNNRKTLLIY